MIEKIVNAVRLNEYLPHKKGGILIMDDTKIEKTGREIAGVGKLYDATKKMDVRHHKSP